MRGSEHSLIVRDHRKLQRLAIIQDATHRDIGRAVWGPAAAHSYVGRIMRGQVRTIRPEHAARWAEFFGVDVDVLFAPQVARNSGRYDRSGVA